MLRCDDLTVVDDGATVLRRCSLEVPAGQVTVLVGEDTAARSALVNTVARLRRQQSGSVLWRGEVIDGWSAERAARAGIALVPAGRRLFTGLTVRENLRVGAARLPRSGEHAAVAGVLERMPELVPRLDIPAGSLSGGEQQLLAVGRALAGSPRLLLIEELAPGLAPQVVRRLVEILRAAAHEGATILAGDDHATVALGAADQVVVLVGGRVAANGSPDDVGAEAGLSPAWAGTVTA